MVQVAVQYISVKLSSFVCEQTCLGITFNGRARVLWGVCTASSMRNFLYLSRDILSNFGNPGTITC